VTIQELLVRDGYWPDIEGPRENVTREHIIGVHLDNHPPGKWSQFSQKVGKYTFSMWLYWPKQETVYTDGAMLIDKGTA
jgi:hypothetical protein